MARRNKVRCWRHRADQDANKYETRRRLLSPPHIWIVTSCGTLITTEVEPSRNVFWPHKPPTCCKHCWDVLVLGRLCKVSLFIAFVPLSGARWMNCEAKLIKMMRSCCTFIYYILQTHYLLQFKILFYTILSGWKDCFIDTCIFLCFIFVYYSPLIIAIAPCLGWVVTN